MRPIIIATVLAVGIHGLLLGMEFDYLKKKHIYRPETRAITMTLEYLQPQVIQSKPDVTKPVTKSVLSSKTQKKSVIFNFKTRSVNEEPETQEEIIYQDFDSTYQEADIDVAVAFDIEKKTPAVREAAPLYRVNPPPEYPGIARKRGYQGTVVLEVLVDQNGRVGDLRLFASSGHSILDRSAMASVKGWLFEPGMKWGKKIDMWVRVPVRFELVVSVDP